MTAVYNLFKGPGDEAMGRSGWLESYSIISYLPVHRTSSTRLMKAHLSHSDEQAVCVRESERERERERKRERESERERERESGGR